MNENIIDIIDSIVCLNKEDKISLFFALGQILTEDDKNNTFKEHLIRKVLLSQKLKKSTSPEDFTEMLSILFKTLSISEKKEWIH